MTNAQAIQTRNILLLMLGQGLSGSLVSLLTLATPLCAQNLIASSQALSQNLVTLPVSATVLGAFLMVYNASVFMAKWGRKKAFIFASTLGMFASILAMIAIILHSFWLFCIATLLLGGFSAFNQYYRFAASEAFLDSRINDIHAKNKATALVIGGGILGAILGPFLASFGANFFITPPFDVAFFGSFFFAFLLCFCALISSIFLELASIQTTKRETKKDTQNILWTLLKDKSFVLGTLACAFGFSLMTLLMNAAPLAMHHTHFDLNENQTVLQWHFIAMYLPSIFLGFWLNKSTPQRIIFYGVLAYILSIVIAITGVGFYSFFFALLFLGIGWAFVFNGGTFLLNAMPTSAYKLKAQGLNSFLTYLCNFIASMSVGFVLHSSEGWVILNLIGAAALACFTLLFYTLHIMHK